jgi:TRAP-type C4-dicarboxylate transport system permease small subunit
MLLLGMVLLIGADVFLRNVGTGGISVSNELSEDAIYLMTLFAAPILLRQGRHIRVDIVLRMVPEKVGWALEWLSDAIGIACCAYFFWYGTKMVMRSAAAGALSIKTLTMPEWWLLAPMPFTFLLLAVEFVFRMHRLANSERKIRDDAVSAS